MEFKKLLNQFDEVLRTRNLPNYEKLEEPLPQEKISFYLDTLNIKDEGFESIFKWKNGFDPNKNSEIVHPQIFDCDFMLSLEIIPEYKKANEDYWDECFIPLLTDNSGRYLLFNNAAGEEYGMLFLYSPSPLVIESYFDSIYTLIQVTVEAYIQNVFKYDHKEDWLDRDIPRYRKIASAINKKSEHWL